MKRKSKNKFNLNDTVKLVSSSYTDERCNPRWNGIHGKTTGKIIELYNSSDFKYCVEWSNGEQNSYTNDDLELIEMEWDT